MQLNKLKIGESVTAESGQYEPYLTKILSHLQAAKTELETSLRIDHDGIVSDHEIKLMNQIKDCLKRMTNAIETDDDF